MRETKVNYRTGESLDIRSVDLFIGIESRETENEGAYTLRTFYSQNLYSREKTLNTGVRRNPEGNP